MDQLDPVDGSAHSTQPDATHCVDSESERPFSMLNLATGGPPNWGSPRTGEGIGVFPLTVFSEANVPQGESAPETARTQSIAPVVPRRSRKGAADRLRFVLERCLIGP